MFNMLIKQIVHIKSFTFTYFIKLKTLLNFFKRVFNFMGASVFCISNRASSCITEAPTVTHARIIVPDLSARMLFSIFMDSITIITSPSLKESPSLKLIFSTLPGSGALMVFELGLAVMGIGASFSATLFSPGMVLMSLRTRIGVFGVCLFL